MFKKTRRKIVAAIMAVLVLLWVGTLGVIYASSYYEMAKQNREMLTAHAEMYTLQDSADGMQPIDGQQPTEGMQQPMEGMEPIEDQQPTEGMQPIDGKQPLERPGPTGDGQRFEDSPVFRLSTFYTVAVSADGEVVEIRNDQQAIHTDEELEALAREVIEGDRSNGTKNSLVFCKTDKGDYTLVAFMDNTIINESAATLFRYTLIFGGAALVLFFFLAVFLARKIVGPVEESYRKQKQFISDAGHELKTPVSVVSANADLLARELGDNRWLANIQYENERMGKLVGQLLELARTENVTPQMERVDFSRLVNGEALPFDGVAFERGLTLECSITPGITVEGNSIQLRQIVSILIDNAIRHSNGGSQVSLSLTKEHGHARLSVVNSGEEIPAEQREQLFERFYRADSARTGEDKHYGLGLAIAKAITESHNGRIEVLCYDGLVEFAVRIPIV